MSFFFMGHPEISGPMNREKQQRHLRNIYHGKPPSKIELFATFLHAYGSSDRRDDSLRTAEAVREKYVDIATSMMAGQV